MNLDEFETKSKMTKSIILGMVEVQEEQNREELCILESHRKYSHVVFFNETIAVVCGTGDSDNVLYTYSNKINGEWKKGNQYYETQDQAILGALGMKYLGLNNQFAQFAAKMLGA